MGRLHATIQYCSHLYSHPSCMGPRGGTVHTQHIGARGVYGHAFSVCKRFFTPSFVPYLSIHTHFYSHSHLSGTQNLPVPQRPVTTVPPLPSTMLCVAASEQRGDLATSSRGLCAEAPRGGSPRHVWQRSSLDLAHRRSPDLAHRRSPDKSAVLLAKMTDDRKSIDTIAALPSVAPLLTVRRQRSMAPSTM